MNKLRFLLPILCAGLTAACAVGPTYRAPEDKTPSAWQAVLPHDGQVTTAEQWWRQFDDPVLHKLVRLTESDNPTLAKAAASIDKARATLASSRSEGLPALSASASASTGTQLVVTGGSRVATSRSAGLDASWELDLFGKVRRNVQAAQVRVQARQDDWHDARVSLASEAADNYVQYRACMVLTKAYDEALHSMVQTDKTTTAAIREGFNAPADGTLSRANLASIRSQLVAQQVQCELLVKSLVSLTGSTEQALRELLGTGKSGVPEPTYLEVQSVPAQAMRQRPDLGSLERELAAASAEIGAAQADLYPSLSLSGSISFSTASLLTTGKTWSFGPSLSIPLFDGGKRRAAVANARASYDSAFADYQQGVRKAVKEVEQALVNLDGAARRTADALSAENEYRDYLASTQSNWRAGGASLLTLEQVRREALDAQINRVTIQRDRVRYWIALYKALGGDWYVGTNPVSTADRSRDVSDQEASL